MVNMGDKEEASRTSVWVDDGVLDLDGLRVQLLAHGLPSD